MIHRNPHASSFLVGRPNLNPVGKIVPFKKDVNQSVPSVAEVKQAVSRGLERPKK